MFFQLEHVSCYLRVFSEVPWHLPTVRTVTIQPWEMGGGCSDDGDQDEKMQRTFHHDAEHAYQCCIALYLIMMEKKIASYQLCNWRMCVIKQSGVNNSFISHHPVNDLTPAM